MNSIVERCTALRAGLTRLGQAKDNEAKAQDLEKRRSELEKVRIQLSEVAASGQVLRAHGKQAHALPDCAKALESSNKVEALLNQDPMTITKGQDYKYLLSRVSKIAETLKASNEQSWHDVVSQHQGVDEAFLRRVERFPGQAQTVDKIRKLKRAYDEATKHIPTNEGAYERFEECYATLQQELTKLDPEAFPEDVLHFFRAAQQATGAPLSLFTTSVRVWLEKHGFLDGVRVRFTGEGGT